MEFTQNETERVIFALQKLVGSVSAIVSSSETSSQSQDLLLATETLTRLLVTSGIAQSFFESEIAEIRETLGFIPGSVVYLTELGYGQRTGTIVSTDYHNEIYVMWDKDCDEGPNPPAVQCDPSTLTLMPHE